MTFIQTIQKYKRKMSDHTYVRYEFLDNLWYKIHIDDTDSTIGGHHMFEYTIELVLDEIRGYDERVWEALRETFPEEFI